MFVLPRSSFDREKVKDTKIETWVYGTKVYEKIENNSNSVERIEDILENIKKDLRATKEDNTYIEKNISTIENNLDEALEKIDLMERRLNKIDRNKKANFVFEVSTNILIVIVLIICLLIAYILFKMRETNTDTKAEMLNIQSKHDEALASLDVKVVNEFEKVLEALKTAGAKSSDNQADHTLPLKVAEEINRMRTRISNMPQDTIGLKALSKALERLEEKLNELEYSIVDLLGKPYVDGLTVQARFVASDSLKKGERIITKILKPQINYKGTLIQSAEVEVSFGE